MNVSYSRKPNNNKYNHHQRTVSAYILWNVYIFLIQRHHHNHPGVNFHSWIQLSSNVLNCLCSRHFSPILRSSHPLPNFFHAVRPTWPTFRLFPMGHPLYHDFQYPVIGHYFHMVSPLWYFTLNWILEFSTLHTNHHVNDLLPFGCDFRFPFIWHTLPAYPSFMPNNIKFRSNAHTIRLIIM